MTTSLRRHPATLEYIANGPMRRLVGWAGRCQPAKAGLFVLGIALATTGQGAATQLGNPGTGPQPVPFNVLGDDEYLIPEVFQSHLPATLQESGLRLSVHPHLGDWENKDHMRLTTTLRYGLTQNCEISVGSNLYFSHGHGNIPAFDSYGAANLKLGAKLNLGQFLFHGWETGAGFDYEFPTGHPPPEMTDGLRHLRPYVSFSHRLESHPDLRIFVGFRMDAVTRTSLPGCAWSCDCGSFSAHCHDSRRRS